MKIRPLPLLYSSLTGRPGIQSMTGADGREGAIFTNLFDLFLIVTTIIFLVVIAFLLVALMRRAGRRQDGLADEGVSHETALRLMLYIWVGVTALILGVFAILSFVADRNLYAATRFPQREIEIRGHQWWWEVIYKNADPSKQIRTANELYLPAGVPVHITLKSDDVIHSFWVPNLAGKQDLIPGRVNDIIIRAERPGLYRGQCAEFCGLQHAHMAMDVAVVSKTDFVDWEQRQRQPAPAPRTPLQLAGYNIFINRQCSSCHAITGTPASGSVAPDLTHVASRASIGAGTFPMRTGHLYAWLADPQSAKPGNNMPTIGLEPSELHALVAYLETLK